MAKAGRPTGVEGSGRHTQATKEWARVALAQLESVREQMPWGAYRIIRMFLGAAERRLPTDRSVCKWLEERRRKRRQG